MAKSANRKTTYLYMNGFNDIHSLSHFCYKTLFRISGRYMRRRRMLKDISYNYDYDFIVEVLHDNAVIEPIFAKPVNRFLYTVRYINRFGVEPLYAKSKMIVSKGQVYGKK